MPMSEEAKNKMRKGGFKRKCHLRIIQQAYL